MQHEVLITCQVCLTIFTLIFQLQGLHVRRLILEYYVIQLHQCTVTISQVKNEFNLFRPAQAKITFSYDPATVSWIKVAGMLPTHPELSQAGSLKQTNLAVLIFVFKTGQTLHLVNTVYVIDTMLVRAECVRTQVVRARVDVVATKL